MWIVILFGLGNNDNKLKMPNLFSRDAIILFSEI